MLSEPQPLDIIVDANHSNVPLVYALVLRLHHAHAAAYNRSVLFGEEGQVWVLLCKVPVCPYLVRFTKLFREHLSYRVQVCVVFERSELDSVEFVLFDHL